MEQRPIFYYGQIKENEIKAGGVLFYRKRKTIELLMIKHNNKYEDFGGKTEIGDKNIYETISREVQEESNNIFSKENIYNRIIDMNPIYNKLCKYILFIVELTNDESNICLSKFGTREMHDNFDRTVEYVTIDNFLSSLSKINFRLTHKFIRKVLHYTRLQFLKNESVNNSINNVLCKHVTYKDKIMA